MNKEQINEDTVLENANIEEKISASKKPSPIVSARNYLQECLDIAQLLPPPKRMLFAMYYNHNLKKVDIAKICNCSPNAVGVRLANITKEITDMRNCMKDDENGESDKSTKKRVEAYFRRENKRRRSLRKS